MISKWILNNFKSISQEKSLIFNSLTIFTGANSSGKSTIIQSILLVAQTLQNPIASRSLVLNGWFKKFGSYGDIVNQRVANKKIKLGFSLENHIDYETDYFFPFETEIKGIDCSFEVYSANANKDDLQPDLDSLRLKVKMDENKTANLDITRMTPTDKVKKIINSLSDKIDIDNLQYRVDANNFRSRYGYEQSDLTPINVTFSHFLPQFFQVAYNRKERCKVIIPELFIGRGGVRDLPNADKRFLENVIKGRCLKIAEDILKDNTDSRRLQQFYNKINNNFEFDSFQKFILKSGLSGDKCKCYIDELITLISNSPDSYGVENQPSYFFPGIEYTRRFFLNSIRYLGPLREEPKSLYPIQDNGSIIEVGLRGEHTASVYQNNKSKIVSYIDPNVFNNCAELDLVKKDAILSEAVNKWLNYLQIASSMTTDENSKYGHELKITTDNSLSQDLTHVGVGVSQVLPILLMSLLAPPGSVILLEQPELHLHPKVQTRLADFFVSMNALGKQCIIETHSEYLINRLRYLVAVSNSSHISDKTIIYFVEKKGGESNYRQVKINKYGTIEDWPDGFFDESERTAAQILRAGMMKKKSEENNSI